MPNSFQGKVLFFINLESGTSNPILGAGMDWLEEFSKSFEHVHVWSTKLGIQARNSEKITFHEIGGGSLIGRTRAIMRLVRLAISVAKKPKFNVVFYHMSHKPAAIIGPFLRMCSVPQGLWYSHSKSSISLRVANWSVDRMFTTNASAFPFQTSKLQTVGHGINLNRFQLADLQSPRADVVCLGRVTPVKKLERLILSVPASLQNSISIDFIGPTTDIEYRNQLEELSLSRGLSINFIGQVPYEDIPRILQRYKLCFTGTPKSVDKAALEAALTGCFVVSDEMSTLEQLGMRQVWENLNLKTIPKLEVQIELLSALPVKTASELRLLLCQKASEQNDLKVTTKRILEALNG
jgi:glycosyltransferase involved in cell wall biosynthesis